MARVNRDPLNLSPSMRKAYDFIHAHGHATPAHKKHASETSVKSLALRGLITLMDVPSGHRNRRVWLALPLGATKPKKIDLPPVPVARTFTVSSALGRGKDSSGAPLTRAARETDKVVPEKQCGGYEVNPAKTANLVLVTWVTPDGMGALQAMDKRVEMLRLYAKILKAADYQVRSDLDAGVLYVSR